MNIFPRFKFSGGGGDTSGKFPLLGIAIMLMGGLSILIQISFSEPTKFDVAYAFQLAAMVISAYISYLASIHSKMIYFFFCLYIAYLLFIIFMTVIVSTEWLWSCTYILPMIFISGTYANKLYHNDI